MVPWIAHAFFESSCLQRILQTQNKINLSVSGFEECFIKICSFKSENISKFCKRGKVKKYKKERNLKALRSSRPHTWLKKTALHLLYSLGTWCAAHDVHMMCRTWCAHDVPHMVGTWCAHDVPRLFITSSSSNSFVKNISVKLLFTSY